MSDSVFDLPAIGNPNFDPVVVRRVRRTQSLFHHDARSVRNDSSSVQKILVGLRKFCCTTRTRTQLSWKNVAVYGSAIKRNITLKKKQ